MHILRMPTRSTLLRPAASLLLAAQLSLLPLQALAQVQPAPSSAPTDPAAIDPLVDPATDPATQMLERLRREHPSAYFRQVEAFGGDDPVTQRYVQRLLDQYDAAVQDRQQLQENAARAVSGYVQAGAKVQKLEDYLAVMTRDTLASEIAEKQFEQRRNQVQKRIIDHRLQVSKLGAQVQAQEGIVRLYVRALQGTMDGSSLELLLSSPSWAHAVDRAAQLESVKDAGVRSIQLLTELRTQLHGEQEALAESERELADVVQSLVEQQAYLRDQRREKEFLLVRTRGQQQLYEQLMSEAQAHQAEVDRELQEVTDALSTLADPEALQHIGQTGAVGQVSAAGFAWPVPPLKITTFFHDPQYREVFPFEHAGIDIRAAQGTEVRSAADGVVYAAQDHGKGYSFVVVLHRDHRSTVYGHLSRIDVKPGQVLTQGQLIGLSGGAIGGEGSGRYTTGPHLHFEMRVSGTPVNPLDLLP